MRNDSRSDALAQWHDRIGAVIDQVGHPDYSLREMADGLRAIRDEMFALQSSAAATASEREQRAVELLRQAHCPNCDGSGVYAVHHPTTGEAMPEQCQWCWERDSILGDHHA